jgi:nicotinamidase-related amidase
MKILKPALLIIDMQNDFVNYINNNSKIDKIVKNTNLLRKEFNKRKLPVIYLKFINQPNNKHIKRAGWDYCLKGNPGSEIINQLKPEKNEIVFEKSENSAFYSLEFKEKLKYLNVNTLVLTGIQTHICILTTASDGYSNDYDVIVLKDCVASSKEQRKKWALWWIKRYAGKVMDFSSFNELLT